MKLATWNVNSLRARLPRVLAFLDEHRPDVLCLQETKVAAGEFPVAEFAAAGYACADHSGGRWAGVAVLSPASTPLLDVRAGLAGEAVPAECRWVEATVADLRVVSVYVPNGRAVGTEAFAQKLAFYEAMAPRVSQLLRNDQRLVIAGDFNVMRADLDLYDPAAFVGSTHVTSQERDRFAAVLDAGLIDAFRCLHPDEPGFTWWDYRAGHFHKKLGLRIDLLLLSEALKPRLRSCGIDRSYRKGPKPSDHAPLLAELA